MTRNPPLSLASRPTAPVDIQDILDALSHHSHKTEAQNDVNPEDDLAFDINEQDDLYTDDDSLLDVNEQVDGNLKGVDTLKVLSGLELLILIILSGRTFLLIGMLLGHYLPEISDFLLDLSPLAVAAFGVSVFMCCVPHKQATDAEKRYRKCMMAMSYVLCILIALHSWPAAFLVGFPIYMSMPLQRYWHHDGDSEDKEEDRVDAGSKKREAKPPQDNEVFKRCIAPHIVNKAPTVLSMLIAICFMLWAYSFSEDSMVSSLASPLTTAWRDGMGWKGYCLATVCIVSLLEWASGEDESAKVARRQRLLDRIEQLEAELKAGMD